MSSNAFSLMDIVDDKISTIKDIKVYRQFVRNGTGVWYIQSDYAASGDWFDSSKLELSSYTGDPNFDAFYSHAADKSVPLNLGGKVFIDLGKGAQDLNDRIDVRLPCHFYHQGRRKTQISFGEITGSAETGDVRRTERILKSSDEPAAFKIIFAPNDYFFRDIDPKLTDPYRQECNFYPEDLRAGGIDQDKIPGAEPKVIHFMFDHAWVPERGEVRLF
jgi:hypothetical protein